VSHPLEELTGIQLSGGCERWTETASK